MSIDMFAKDGCVTIYGTSEDSMTAFSEDGIEYLLKPSLKNDRQARRLQKVSQRR